MCVVVNLRKLSDRSERGDAKHATAHCRVKQKCRYYVRASTLS